MDDILPLLRLVVPFGDPTGLAPPAPVPVVCEIGQRFALRFSPEPKTALALLQGVGEILQSAALTTRFPQIAHAPHPNVNILWATHNKLRQLAAYADLAMDIQIGPIRLLEHAYWQQHRAARQTIDATLTAFYRILPLLDAGELAQALAAGNPVAAGEMVQRAAPGPASLRSSSGATLSLASGGVRLDEGRHFFLNGADGPHFRQLWLSAQERFVNHGLAPSGRKCRGKCSVRAAHSIKCGFHMGKPSHQAGWNRPRSPAGTAKHIRRTAGTKKQLVL